MSSKKTARRGANATEANAAKSAKKGPAKPEFSQQEIRAARARLEEEIATASVTSRRSRLAAAAGLGSIGGLSPDIPGNKAAASDTVGSQAATAGGASSTPRTTATSTGAGATAGTAATGAPTPTTGGAR